MSFAVCVTFIVKAGQMDVFLPLMVANAHTSLHDEAGCLQFDVLTDPARPDEVFLYEIYKDADAFDLHLASMHFKIFETAVENLIFEKVVKTYVQVSSQ